MMTLTMEPKASSKTHFSELFVKQLVDRILARRQIARFDQQLLMSMLMSEKEINEADKRQIDRIFEALRNGRIRVVD